MISPYASLRQPVSSPQPSAARAFVLFGAVDLLAAAHKLNFGEHVCRCTCRLLSGEPAADAARLLDLKSFPSCSIATATPK